LLDLFHLKAMLFLNYVKGLSVFHRQPIHIQHGRTSLRKCWGSSSEK